MQDRLTAAVDDLRRAVQELADEVKEDARVASLLKLHAALNSLESQCGCEPTELGEFFGYQGIFAVAAGQAS